jgi:hypothetical protein
MRGKLLVIFAAVALGLTLGVSSARADQITLGDTNCSGGPWTITTGPTVTGSTFSCSGVAIFSSGYGNITGLSYAISPDEIHVFGAGNDLQGTITWTYSTGLIQDEIDLLAGWLTVTGTPSGFHGEYASGSVYRIDLTLQGCSQEDGVVCTDPSSGQIPVPEPGTLSLLGMGLIGMAGYFRRKFGS